MPSRKFDDLPVWRAAMDLAVQVFDLGGRGVFRGHPGLRDQLERAVLSVSNNIAEGHERGTNEELLTFLYYARGSAGEVRSMLLFLERAGEWSGFRGEIATMASLCLSVTRQLGGWTEAIKNSNHPGARTMPHGRPGRRTNAGRHSWRNSAAPASRSRGRCHPTSPPGGEWRPRPTRLEVRTPSS